MASDKLWIDKDLPASLAFRSLKRVSFIVYFDFIKKRKMVKGKTSSKRRNEWVITNNGKITYSYKEAQKKGLSPAQYRDALDELSEKGFLSIAHQGSGGRGKGGKEGDVTLFRLDDRWKDYGTKRFRKTSKPRTKDTRQGRGWALLMNDPKKKDEILKKRERTRRKNSLLKTTVKKPNTSVENNRPLKKKSKTSFVEINRPLEKRNVVSANEY